LSILMSSWIRPAPPAVFPESILNSDSIYVHIEIYSCTSLWRLPTVLLDWFIWQSASIGRRALS
jgi:hypothetical protein